MAHQNSIRYALLRVTTEQFAKIYEPENDDNIELNITININSSYSDRAIAITPSINFKDSGNTFLVVESTCHFKIEPNDWNSLSNENSSNVTIPKDVILNMVSISLGTARGVLHSKTENTEFNKYYLPLIDPQVFGGEELIIEKVVD